MISKHHELALYTLLLSPNAKQKLSLGLVIHVYINNISITELLLTDGIIQWRSAVQDWAFSLRESNE
jgi:hypothetical protein